MRPLEMGDELAIISYSTERHVDAGTLSRIRSHAQQSVQDQKWHKKVKKASPDAYKKSAQDAAKNSSQPEFLQLIFDKRSGKEVKRPSIARNPSSKSAAKRKKVEDEFEHRMVKRESHSLSASPSERPDPFAAFPVKIDAHFMDLFEGYSQSWKWQGQSPQFLFRENMSNPVLAHSVLSIANHVWAKDEARSIFHEDLAMMHISQGLSQLNRLAPVARREMASSLVWAIIRLATMKVNTGQLEQSMIHLNALALIDREDWEQSPFAQHFQAAMASLLLANYHQAGRVKPLLHMPFGSMATNAVDDVEAEGYEVPEAALMLHWELQGFFQSRVSDALLGLTALYNICGDESLASDGSVPHMHSGKKASQAVKIALRLAQYNTPASSPAEIAGDWLADFQECVRLVGLLWTWTFGRKVLQNIEAISSTQRRIARTFTPQLLRVVLHKCSNKQAMSDLLVWMLIVCGSAAMSSKSRQQYASLLRALLPWTEGTSYAQIRLLGTKLPWLELSADSPMEDFWRLVRSGSTIVELQDPADDTRGAAPPLLGYANLVSRSRGSPPSAAELQNIIDESWKSTT